MTGVDWQKWGEMTNRKRKDPGGGEPWVTVSAVDGIIAGFGVLPWLCGLMLAALSWTVWFDLRSGETPFFLGLGTVGVMATTLEILKFESSFGGWFMWPSWSSMNKLCMITPSALVNSGSNVMCFDCSQCHRFTLSTSLCSWPSWTGWEVADSSAQVYLHNRKNLD